MSFEISVRKRLGERDIHVNFRSDAKLTAIIGPSGCGKTSLLNMVAGLLRPDEGHIVAAGKTLFDSAAQADVPVEERRVGYVFQDGRLFPHMRVRDNLLYSGRVRRTEDHSAKLQEMASFLGIETLLNRWPNSLSGGEAQRVTLGRTLLSDPDLLLMDEPLGALDMARREEIMKMIEHVRDDMALPILYVSHDPREVERLSDTVIAM